MIISDTHHYLFIEQPHTASTTIQTELLELYAGRRILDRHAVWWDFVRVATPEQKRYFVFSGMRNPLDEAVSQYFKYKTDHLGGYTRAAMAGTFKPREQRIYEAVIEQGVSFQQYLHLFYDPGWDNNTLIYHEQMDEIIRYEHLQEDFSRVLAKLGLEQVRPLPIRNKTGERASYLDYYPADPPEFRPYAAAVFGPFMETWGYELPAEWDGVTVSRAARRAFRLRRPWRAFDRRFIRRSRNPAMLFMRELSRPVRRLVRRIL